MKISSNFTFLLLWCVLVSKVASPKKTENGELKCNFFIFDWIEPILLASKELKSCCVKKAMDK